MSYNMSKAFLLKKIKAGIMPDQIADEFGCAKSTVYLNLRRFKIKLPGRDLKPGDEFNDLVVICRDGSKGHDSCYKCRCKRCGSVRTYRRSNIRTGNTQSCGCARRGVTGSMFKGHGQIGSKLWSQIKLQASQRNLSFDLTIESAWQLFQSQHGRCALSGRPIYFKDYEVEQTASLDRIDSLRGYSINNVQWVHKDVNRMKQHFPQDYFLMLCRDIATMAAPNKF